MTENPSIECDAGRETTESCKVLIIKLSSLGDLFHALPAVAALKERLSASIHWCVNSDYVDLVKCFNDVDRIIPFPRRSFLKNFSRFRAELRKDEYDYVIDMQGLLKSCMVLMMAKGKRKIGPSFAREGTAFLYPEKAAGDNKRRHAVYRIMDVLHYLNLPPLDAEFRVSFPSPSVEGGHPRIGIAPSSRWLTKTWPAVHFIDTAKRMLKIRPMTFYIIGGAGDRNLCEEVASGIGHCAQNMSGIYTIPESGGVISQMDLLITNDSGPMHMATAAGVPVLAIFGPTDEKSTGPYGSNNRVMKSDVSCRPCLSRRCREGGLRCLEDVSSSQVAEAATDMLELVAYENK